jgi:hypothetical protein
LLFGPPTSQNKRIPKGIKEFKSDYLSRILRLWDLKIGKQEFPDREVG